MKKYLVVPKFTSVLLLLFIISMGISCKDQKSQKSQKNLKDQLEDDDSFAGSSKRDDICQLLSKDDIMAVFELSEENKLEQTSSHETICKYDWSINEGESTFFTASLNFARGGQQNDSQIESIWKDQNNGIFKKHHPQEVSDVGDKASWSDLGGGQLRVAAKGYIFYVSLSIMYGNKDLMDKQEMIDKTKVLAKRVIDRM